MRRDLIAWAGHDLRTPLASVRAIVEALADGVVEDPDTVQRYLRTAQRDILSLSALIDDLFELSQLDTGGLQLAQRPNSLADLVSDTIESFSTLAAQRQVTLTGEVAAGVDPVVLDGGKIGRVLANLVGNALRHTPSGGAVRIEVSRPGDKVIVRVCDTGEGIPPADLPHVFKRFYRGEKSRNPRPAAPAWAWQSPRGSWRRTTARFGPRTRRAPAHASPSCCPIGNPLVTRFRGPGKQTGRSIRLKRPRPWLAPRPGLAGCGTTARRSGRGCSARGLPDQHTGR